MKNAAVSDIGNVLQTGAALGGTTVKTAATGKTYAAEDAVDFSTVMKQAGSGQVKQLAAQSDSRTDSIQTSVSTENSAERTKTDTDTADTVSDEYGKYRYRDNSIASETNEPVDTDSVAEDAGQFAEDVKQVLKDALGVSDEQIEDAMAALGLQFADLLDTNHLAELVGDLTGADSVQQLLCSETFTDIMQSVKTLGNELLDELGMSAEEFQAALDTAVLQQQTPVTKEAPEISVDGDLQTVQEAAFETTDKAAGNAEVAAATAETNVRTASNGPDGDAAVSEQPKEAVQTAQQPETAETSDMAEENTSGEENPENDFSQNDFSQNENQTGVTDTNAAHDVAHAGENVSAQQVQTTVQTSATAEAEVPQTQTVNVQDVMDQIVESARVLNTEHRSSVELQLNPENLGRVLVRVTEEEGVIHARLFTQNEVVKEALETQTAQLRQNLEQAGVKVDAVEVSVASHEFERNLEQNAEGEKQQGEQQEKAHGTLRRLNLNDLDDLSGVMSEEEALVARMMAEQGNTVDYTA